uniref:Uncharacterized protein n=1 Tax=Octopus bimaculoides TaxID=37653 RepID=A0A0L8H2F0_OCTBM
MPQEKLKACMIRIVLGLSGLIDFYFTHFYYIY